MLVQPAGEDDFFRSFLLFVLSEGLKFGVDSVISAIIKGPVCGLRKDEEKFKLQSGTSLI